MKKFRKSEAGFTLGGFILEFVQSIVLALSVFVLLYLFVAQPNEVRGSSMVPNFFDGEFLLTDKLTYRFSNPKTGDVVVFKAPPSEACAEEECEYIKRIIAEPGDKIMVKDGHIYVNGLQVPENFLANGMGTMAGSFALEGVERTIPEDHYLCLGDNRAHSRDSREFGPIHRDLIVGKAFFKYWPPRAVGFVPKVSI